MVLPRLSAGQGQERGEAPPCAGCLSPFCNASLPLVVGGNLSVWECPPVGPLQGAWAQLLPVVPNLSGIRDPFRGRQLFCGWGWGSSFGMIQARYISCALYFYYYPISSSSDHQASEPRGWGPLLAHVARPGSRRLRPGLGGGVQIE